MRQKGLKCFSSVIGRRQQNIEHSAMHIPLVCLGISDFNFNEAKEIYKFFPHISQGDTEYFHFPS
jgi:hypothetical protein